MGNCYLYPANRNSRCVASFSDKICVTQENSILIYQNEHPYKYLYSFDMSLSTNGDATSIVSCNRDKCLYVYDPVSDYILKVLLESDVQMHVWLFERGDFKLSVTREGDVLIFEQHVEYPSLRIFSNEGTVKRTISVERRFSQTQYIQAITPDFVALSYQKSMPRGELASGIAIMRLDENGTILRDITWPREVVCLSCFRNGGLLIGDHRNESSAVNCLQGDSVFRKSQNVYEIHDDLLSRSNVNGVVSMHHWPLESKISRYDLLTSNGEIRDIHFAAEQGQLFVRDRFAINIFQFNYEDEDSNA